MTPKKKGLPLTSKDEELNAKLEKIAHKMADYVLSPPTRRNEDGLEVEGIPLPPDEVTNIFNALLKYRATVAKLPEIPDNKPKFGALGSVKPNF